VREGWRIERVAFDIDEHSTGEALYRVHARDRVFDFVVYGFQPDLSSQIEHVVAQHAVDVPMEAIVDFATQLEQRGSGDAPRLIR
ncbi:MAG: hypothetical protein REJ50_16840, partial [Bordetella sp.]|nr:hypothetical protein [Bordetella sp.]